MKSVCIAILNYNGVHHLKELLPSLGDGIGDYSGHCSVVVLDNRSTNGDCEWVETHFPDVEVVRAPRNEILHSYNWLGCQRSEEILIFLNNDTRLAPNFVAPLITHFAREDVFSVMARSTTWDGKQDTSGPSRLRHSNGWYDWAYDTTTQVRCHTLFTSGGFMAVNREKFLALNGFNPLFFPMYCEDLDIGFRAWRRGWRCIYEPESVLFHREGGSDSGGKARVMNLRNSLLFQWASLPMAKGRWKRRANLARTVAATAIRRADFHWLMACLQAIARWLRLRRQYSWMKVSQSELDVMIAKMDEPC